MHDSQDAASPLAEAYPSGWLHAVVHLNPRTGELHSDGDSGVLAHIKQRMFDPPTRVKSDEIEPLERAIAFYLQERDDASLKRLQARLAELWANERGLKRKGAPPK